MVGRCDEQADPGPDWVRQDVLRQAHAAQHPHQVLRASTVDRMLLVMRPYQIVATERILQRIETSTNHRQLGTIAAGGYVWHTTGSGKTLTSFKTAQLASRLPDVDKVAVRRRPQGPRLPDDARVRPLREGRRQLQHLDRRPQAAARGPGRRIIITTIQKLATLRRSQNKGHAIYDGHVVIIFDECHRSQFGDMHTAITKAFKRYHLFGFTGTPIFAGERRHRAATRYCAPPSRRSATGCTPTRSSMRSPTRTCCRSGIDYVNTIKLPDGIADKQVSAIDTERALLHRSGSARSSPTSAEHFDQKTKRSRALLSGR